MHLMSCEHPVRVFNKYIGEYVWTTCGKCNSCRNRRAKYWTDACERERSASIYTLFVTLTYDNLSLPVYNYTGGFDSVDAKDDWLRASRERDVECIPISKELFDTDADKDLFYGLLKGNGIPYASKTDIQLFNKRLNKYFFQNVTHNFKNFRYFIVSELGSTTLRPHFHGLFFVNDSDCARRFEEAVSSCWKYGRIDVQYVENSACSYVAQYVNKLFDLPSFYKARPIRPFFLASRNPIIGTYNKSAQSDEEIFNKCLVTTFSPRTKDSKFVLSPIDPCTENRLFPKCPFYRTVSYSVRAQLYSAVRRFGGEKFEDFRKSVEDFLSSAGHSEFFDLLRVKVDDFSLEGLNWLRRLYYLSRKVCRQALRFGVSLFAYVQKIDEYWNKKELYLLKQFYAFQEDYVKQAGNLADDLLLMYPDTVRIHYASIGTYLSDVYTPFDVIDQRDTAKRFAFSNKRTHFKNMYLDSIKDKNHYLFNLLKNFYHAKECNEINQAISS